MADLGISQMPLKPVAGQPLLMIHEVDLLRALASGKCTYDSPALCAAAKLSGQVRSDDPLSKVQMVFDDNNVAVVIEDDTVVAMITKIDVVEFLAART